MFGNKDKRAAASDGREAANAAFRAEVERLEALPTGQVGGEVMVKGFGPGGSRPALLQRESYAVATAHAHNVDDMFEPEGARDADLYERLSEVVGEGLQVLEHESLIWARSVAEGLGVGYAPTRQGRAALEADALEQTLRGKSAESA